MALKLKRLVSSPNEHDDGSSFNVLSNVSPAKKMAGQSTPPPPQGSEYSKFLDWASNESLEPTSEERSLALRLWVGKDVDDIYSGDAPAIKM